MFSFFTLVDIWWIDFCRPALKSRQNVIHSAVSDNIDSAPYPSISSSSYRIEVAAVGPRDPKRFRRAE